MKTSLAKAARPAKRKPRPARPRRRPSRTPGAAFPIVGIGASAGGLEAMTQLLKHLPARTGMAFVLVQHLDPTHESALTALLSRLTDLQVSEAKHNTRLQPNQLYVIPPNKLMGVAGGRLKLFPRRDTNAHLPIDEFLHSLAAGEGSRAIGVILSGNGADGTRGLLNIKAAGGLTFAQEEKTAKYPGMPGNAITAGCVDFVLPPDRIARELGRIAGHPYVIPGAPVGEDVVEAPAPAKVFEEILLLLRQRMGVDFTFYKHATLQRRIQRRMVLHKMESLKDYAVYLRAHAHEVKELFGDILIHVTSFFRDVSVFHALKKRLFSRIVKAKSPDDPIRIWVPGCSTGEEVYSIAIALAEYLSDHKLTHPVQIFGTDIYETALERARAGVYPESIKSDVSGERLRRFFVKTSGGYRVTKAVREMCIFARQNVVMDPPFSGLDFISCRNLLIYLGPPLQRKVFPLFHYALKPNAFLMLGASETVGGFSDLFSLLDTKAKLYVKKATHLRAAVTFGPALPEPATKLHPTKVGVSVGPVLAEVQRQADRIMLTHYGPAGVVINRQLEVLHFRGQTGLFLEHAHGEASLNLLKMVRESLLSDLRAALNRALKQNVRVRQSGLRVRQNGGFLEVAVEVIPFTTPPSPEKFYLVLFQPASPDVPPAHKLPAHKLPAHKLPAHKLPAHKLPAHKLPAQIVVERAELSRLRGELAATRESLQAIIEEQEATNEELRSANEETMSSNEELQSTNEELTTLNDELESRNTELEHVNNDLHNLLGNVNIPIIILGANLKIRRFTGVAEKLFNLIPGDIGRPITDINLPLDLPDLPKLVVEVIDNLTAKELEAKDRDGHWWSVRVRPYKTIDNKIDGAVIALVDIDLIKSSAQAISEGRAFADALINTMHQPVLLLDGDLSVQAANQAFLHEFNVNAEETLNHRVYSLGNGQWDIPKLRTLLEDILPQNSSFEGFEVEHNFPRLGRRKMKLDARRLLLKGNKHSLVLLSFGDLTKPD